MTTKKPDGLIQQEIQARFRPSPGGEGVDYTGVSVAVEGGKVTLTGHVPDFDAWEAASLVAQEVAGPFSVSNLIQVHRQVPDSHRDAELVRAVVEAFGKGHHAY